MLSTYGESRTVQNLTLKTLSGVPVELRSGESIPYVDNVSLNVNYNSSTSGAKTTTVDTGFDINITPFYDAEDNLVTVELDLEMKSLVGFKELSAGDQLGTLTRPQVQDQSIKNIARMEAGETALIGGLVYESASDNRTGLAGFEHVPIGSKAKRNNYNALFILMRPTVVVYGPRSEMNEVPAP
jgi:type II secretory pathway component GspD/PulD (secretin)